MADKLKGLNSIDVLNSVVYKKDDETWAFDTGEGSDSAERGKFKKIEDLLTTVIDVKRTLFGTLKGIINLGGTGTIDTETDPISYRSGIQNSFLTMPPVWEPPPFGGGGGGIGGAPGGAGGAPAPHFGGFPSAPPKRGDVVPPELVDDFLDHLDELIQDFRDKKGRDPGEADLFKLEKQAYGAALDDFDRRAAYDESHGPASGSGSGVAIPGAAIGIGGGGGVNGGKGGSIAVVPGNGSGSACPGSVVAKPGSGGGG